MDNTYAIGNNVRGKVTGVQRYGAFVSFDGSRQGLIHISEITDGFVRDIHDFLSIGEFVTVKILSIEELSGKMSLSLKAVHSSVERPNAYVRKQHILSIPKTRPDGFLPLKEKLKEWIVEANSHHHLS
ncbi:MAG: CvfD/Ygs/GSP13 family RNA-binding post-transcriptional regulator [Bacilli bacterium]